MSGLCDKQADRHTDRHTGTQTGTLEHCMGQKSPLETATPCDCAPCSHLAPSLSPNPAPSPYFSPPYPPRPHHIRPTVIHRQFSAHRPVPTDVDRRMTISSGYGGSLGLGWLNRGEELSTPLTMARSDCICSTVHGACRSWLGTRHNEMPFCLICSNVWRDEITCGLCVVSNWDHTYLLPLCQPTASALHPQGPISLSPDPTGAGDFCADPVGDLRVPHLAVLTHTPTIIVHSIPGEHATTEMQVHCPNYYTTGPHRYSNNTLTVSSCGDNLRCTLTDANSTNAVDSVDNLSMSFHWVDGQLKLLQVPAWQQHTALYNWLHCLMDLKTVESVFPVSLFAGTEETKIQHQKHNKKNTQRLLILTQKTQI